MVETALEYAAFGGSLCSVWLYGKGRYLGPVSGVVASVLFIAYGVVQSVDAAVASNLVFLGIHGKNFKNAWRNDMDKIKKKIAEDFNALADKCHKASFSSGWWNDKDGNPLSPENDYHIATKISLIHTEVGEATEAHRRNAMDDKIPHRLGIECELADVIIRVGDLAAALNLDVGGAIAEKMEFNSVRPDHKPENRAKAGGKAY